jgi:hypothetical protein
MLILLAALLGLALAAVTYLYFERAGPRAGVPLIARALAWALLLLLAFNVSCPAPAERLTPLVLLDASLSMQAAGGQWAAARDSAAATGEVVLFGDGGAGPDDSLPSLGRSLLRPALVAVAASDRPVEVLTDGELEDARDLPADLVDRVTVRVFPRDSVTDDALTLVSGPDRVTAGDSIVLEIDVRRFHSSDTTSVPIEVALGERVLARGRAAMDQGGTGRARIALWSSALAAGEHVLTLRRTAAADAEPATDMRLHRVVVTASPGVVLLASPGDWDARTLYRVLRDVAQLPVRGYVQLERDRWRSMESLAPVDAATIRRSARGADLLVLKGRQGRWAEGTGARGLWLWPSGENGEALLPGDWYLNAAEVSPVASAFLGLPLDSFPPAIRITPIQPAEGDIVVLHGQERRRGAERPVVTVRADRRRRSALVAADGLWRWAFREGASEDAYRAWVAATTTWLLAGTDSVRGVARVPRPVVERGRPLVFEWAGQGSPRDAPLVWSFGDSSRADTLRFDGAGRAEVLLPPGEYRYRLSEGGTGVVAVEAFSSEYLPRPVTIAARAARTPRPSPRESVREQLWLFALALAALAVEWWWRRRMGLR